jgi:hypothetical protein
MRGILHTLLDPMLTVISRVLLNRTNIPKETARSGIAIRMLASKYLTDRYPELLSNLPCRRGLTQYECRVFSQAGEDGILLHIFSCIGVKNRTFVEFGAQDGLECNTANLSINFGWSGLLMDGSEENVKLGRNFYKAQLGSRADTVKFIQAWITVENIQTLIAEHGMGEAIDLLSIDIDGNDYWVWKAIDIINPRVVVIEYNAAYGSTRSLTIPYNPLFQWHYHPRGLNRRILFWCFLGSADQIS